MSKDVVVVATCTHRYGLMDVYEHQLKEAGIDTCFESGMQQATAYYTMRQRLGYWQGIAQRFHDYKMIIVTDAWDVMFFGTKEEVLAKRVPFMISSERNCAPEAQYAGSIHNDKPCKYANCGMMTATPEGLFEWITKATEVGDLDFKLSSGSDQAWFNRRLAGNVEVAKCLDDTTNLLYVISWADGHLEDGTLRIKDGRMWNSAFDTYPNFFHFAGHGPCEPLRILPGEGAPRYGTQQLARDMMTAMGWHSCGSCGIAKGRRDVVYPHPK